MRCCAGLAGLTLGGGLVGAIEIWSSKTSDGVMGQASRRSGATPFCSVLGFAAAGARLRRSPGPSCAAAPGSPALYVGRWSRGAIEIWSSKTPGGVAARLSAPEARAGAAPCFRYLQEEATRRGDAREGERRPTAPRRGANRRERVADALLRRCAGSRLFRDACVRSERRASTFLSAIVAGDAMSSRRSWLVTDPEQHTERVSVLVLLWTRGRLCSIARITRGACSRDRGSRLVRWEERPHRAACRDVRDPRYEDPRFRMAFARLITRYFIPRGVARRGHAFRRSEPPRRPEKCLEARRAVA